jgi:hypothetical protein
VSEGDRVRDRHKETGRGEREVEREKDGVRVRVIE